MKYIVLDTESSGINTRTAELYSIGAFSVEDNPDGTLNMNTLKGIHRFFNTDDEVPAPASAVNHLTRDYLLRVSNGDYLEDCYQELNDFIYQPESVLVGYNTRFDRDIIYNNCANVGIPLPRWRDIYDVMYEQKVLLRGGGYDNISRLRLTSAVNIILKRNCGYTEESLLSAFNLLKQACGITNGEANAHSALYDAFTTLMIFREIKKLK